MNILSTVSPSVPLLLCYSLLLAAVPRIFLPSPKFSSADCHTNPLSLLSPWRRQLPANRRVSRLGRWTLAARSAQVQALTLLTLSVHVALRRRYVSRISRKLSRHFSAPLARHYQKARVKTSCTSRCSAPPRVKASPSPSVL